MKNTRERSMIATLMMASTLAASGVALAQQNGNLPTLPQVQHQDQVQFLSGGIGEGQSDAMKAAAGKYRLMLTFVQRGPDGQGQYLADIPVEITNAQGTIVLKTVSEGPYLLANLPAGSYSVKASSGGNGKTQRVSIATSGTAHAVFEWR